MEVADLGQNTFWEVKVPAFPNKVGTKNVDPEIQNLKENQQTEMHPESNDFLILLLFAKEHHALPRFLHLPVKRISDNHWNHRIILHKKLFKSV